MVPYIPHCSQQGKSDSKVPYSLVLPPWSCRSLPGSSLLSPQISSQSSALMGSATHSSPGIMPLTSLPLHVGGKPSRDLCCARSSSVSSTLNTGPYPSGRGTQGWTVVATVEGGLELRSPSTGMCPGACSGTDARTRAPQAHSSSLGWALGICISDGRHRRFKGLLTFENLCAFVPSLMPRVMPETLEVQVHLHCIEDPSSMV